MSVERQASSVCSRCLDQLAFHARPARYVSWGSSSMRARHQKGATVLLPYHATAAATLLAARAMRQGTHRDTRARPARAEACCSPARKDAGGRAEASENARMRLLVRV